ncbi:MAG: efflux RND transporter periplasmic adaptor subunit [Candidatus Gracilibacteria bacterium]
MFKIKFSLKYFIPGIIIILGINYSTFLGSIKTDTTSSSNQTTEIVEEGSIKNTIDAVGSAKLVDEQSLKFTKQGTIKKVYFKEGDKVKKGDIIAEIDNSDGLSAIKDAEISLDNAKINYDQLFDDPDQSKILQAQNSIKSSQDNLDTAKKQLEILKITQANSIDSMEKSIESAKADLDLSKTSLIASKQDLETTKKTQANSLSNTVSNKSVTVQNIEASLKTNLTNIEKIIEDADNILGVTVENRTRNDEFESFLGAKNSGIKTQAESSLLQSISLYTKLKTSLSKYDYSGDLDTLKDLLQQFITTYKSIGDTADLTYKTVDASIESVGALTASDISTMKSTMSSDRSSAQNTVITINSSLNTINTSTDVDLVAESNTNTITQQESSIKSSENSITKKEIDIQNSEKDLETTKQNNAIDLQSKQNSIASLEKTLEVNNQSLNELIKGPTVDNIKKANNSIDQALMKLETANKGLDDYRLESPFDGVVRKIDYMVGDNILSDSEKYIYIENPDLLEITVNLDQIDIMKVKVGTKATVTFDALPNKPVTAEISSIDPTPIQSSGVVSYEIKIVLDNKDFNKTILSGMTANIEIVTEEKEKTLLVSSTAVTTESGSTYVTLMKNNSPTKTEVVTGISSGGKTEIVSGLSKGDTVLTTKFVPASNSGSTKPAGLFSIPTRGGGSGGGSNRSFGGPGG